MSTSRTVQRNFERFPRYVLVASPVGQGKNESGRSTKIVHNNKVIISFFFFVIFIQPSKSFPNDFPLNSGGRSRTLTSGVSRSDSTTGRGGTKKLVLFNPKDSTGDGSVMFE